ncbi:class I SAM-dependent methyltransferase [Mesorhizobium sp. WSM4982]|uniref:class I SAM-dependent methyltransferase n=1 Tax=Mesorhizobium sp. WSM4982 TaxID=3038550 RepID=UPI0024156195|nr:class I SAM-dependent methyltransferase [Mesorhizobium sp. WSM4982]MDG4856413.1 class I SAM-dependent methyltransferase [Mesorhizobium sp. WSM4982]
MNLNAQLEHVHSPTDIVAYATRMKSSMSDKTFFVERVPAEVTVFADFGCADGKLLREVHLQRREWPQGWGHHYIGFDHNAGMIELAKHKRTIGNFEYTADFAMFAARIERHHRKGLKSCLILSSVVHEVMSQQPDRFIPFWHELKRLGCEYIAIRDMGVDREAYHTPVSEEEFRAVTSGPAAENMRHWLLEGAAEPGMFSHRAELLEALLKCDYRDNWDNELAERYFPLTADQWVNFTTVGSGYRLRHFDHSPIPFLQAKWKERYGLYVPDATHVKLLLHRDC